MLAVSVAHGDPLLYQGIELYSLRCDPGFPPVPWPFKKPSWNWAWQNKKQLKPVPVPAYATFTYYPPYRTQGWVFGYEYGVPRSGFVGSPFGVWPFSSPLRDRTDQPWSIYYYPTLGNDKGIWSYKHWFTPLRY